MQCLNISRAGVFLASPAEASVFDVVVVLGEYALNSVHGLLAGGLDPGQVIVFAQNVPLVLAQLVIGQQFHFLDTIPNSAMNWPSPSALSSSSDQVGTTT